MKVRVGRPDEAEVLSVLALRSKGYWGYDRAFLDACRHELTLEPEDFGRLSVFVADDTGHIAGFCALQISGDEAEVTLLFVDPVQIGCGVGRMLWNHAEASARREGVRTLQVSADPNAVSFYEAMGARAVSEVPSASIPGRFLPQMQKPLVSEKATNAVGE